MIKKITIITSIVIIILTASWYVLYKTDIFSGRPQTGDVPEQLGSIITKPLKSDTEAGTEINNLQKALPLVTTAFTIKSYDYSKGLFIVELGADPSDTAENFFTWKETSSYSAIPKSMFYFK